MEKPAVLQKRDCWICFNSENNTTLTKPNGEKLLKSCKTYLDTLNIIESFENETIVSCCSYCYESALQLTNLEEKVKKLQKEILHFSLVFWKTVVERRGRVGNEKDRNHDRYIPQIGKCCTLQNNPDSDSIVILENCIVKTEVNESLSNELQLDSQRKTEKDNFVTNSWFATDDIENVIEDERENIVHSNDEIDVKYSFNDTFSKVPDIANEEIVPKEQLKLSTTNVLDVPKRKTMSMSDLLKSVKMPIIQLKRYLPERSKNSSMVIVAFGEVNQKYEKAFEDSTESKNCPEILSTVPPFKCRETTCGKSFRIKWDLVRHEKIHSGIKPYKCSICSKSFTWKHHLKEHESLHSGERPYKCHLCEKTFKRSSNLRSHKIIHSERKPFKCSFCDKSFKSSSNLSAHETIHSAKTAYKCSFCEKSFELANALRVHETIHTNKKPYKCSWCEKSFQRPVSLKEHVNIHTGERPFECSFCSKSFHQSGDLNRHKRIHTGDRPHKCSFCSKSFLRSKDAKNHEMIHTGEKPYKCSSCEKAFTQSNDLKVHYNRMHQNEEKNEEFILPN